MEYPKVSIIVPVYNVERYLEQCLGSLIHQSYSNIEIICINDGSTDNSSSILNKYSSIDSRIVVSNQINSGVSGARNKGIKIATGDYLMFVDSDDWIDSETCEVCLNRLISHNADVALFTYLTERNNKSIKKNIFSEDKLFNEDTVSQLHRRMVGLNNSELTNPENADALVPVWMKIYKMEIIRKKDIRFIDLSNIGTSEDALFNLEYFHNIKRAIYINEPYYHYRRDNNESITTKYKSDLFEKWNNLFNYFERYIKENKLGNEYLEALNNRIALSIIGLGLNEINSNKRPAEIIIKIKKIISSTLYKEAYKSLKLNYLPLHWKVFFLFAKFNSAIGLYLLLIIIKKMK